jgi:hypothetical protein
MKTSMSENLAHLEMAIGGLVALDEVGRTTRCTGCDQHAMIGEVIQHQEECRVEYVMEAFRALYASCAEMRLIVPEKMPAQGIYSNMLTLLALHHVLTNSQLPASKMNDLFNLSQTITGTMVGLVKQMKGHVKGRTVIDQVLELILPAKASTPE